jgi:hypothetical protein
MPKMFYPTLLLPPTVGPSRHETILQGSRGLNPQVGGIVQGSLPSALIGVQRSTFIGKAEVLCQNEHDPNAFRTAGWSLLAL